jgi:hypothetical protein
MAKSITQKFGSPTIGKRNTKTATAKVTKVLPKKGVILQFIATSNNTKAFLKSGARLRCVRRIDCHGRPYVVVELLKPIAKAPKQFCLTPTAVKAVSK